MSTFSKGTIGIGMSVLFCVTSSLFATESYTASYIKGEEHGLNRFILEAFAEQLKSVLDIQINYRGATLARNLLLAQQGSSDLVILAKISERETYLHYIEPVLYTITATFVVRKGEHATIQDYHDLYGMRIGTFRDSNLFPQFDKDKKLNKFYRNSIPEDLAKLSLNRLDAVILPKQMASYEIWKLSLQDKVELSDYDSGKPIAVHIALSKKSSIILRSNEVEPLIQKMIMSGQIRKRIEQFYLKRDLPIPKLW